MHSTTLIDPDRLEQISILCGTPRPFYGHSIGHISNKAWASVSVGEYLYAIPLKLRDRTSFGHLTERVFLLIHCRVRQEKKRDVVITYDEFRNWLWSGRTPKNWRERLHTILRSLKWLRIGQLSEQSNNSDLAETVRIIATIKHDRIGRAYRFEIAKGFLGSLEKCAVDDDGHIRYEFHDKRILRELRGNGHLVEVYLPAHLGDREKCQATSFSQKLLLQQVLREHTLPTRSKNPENQDSAIVQAGRVPSFNGKEVVVCSELDPTQPHVAFGGNGVLRGRGYRIATWQERAGYAVEEREEFLKDLEILSRQLDLKVAALDRDNNWYSINQLRMLSRNPRRSLMVSRLHLRVYAPADYLSAWDLFYGWNEFLERERSTVDGVAIETRDILDRLLSFMAKKRLRQVDVANQLGISKQRLSKMLRNDECSENVRLRILGLISEGSRGKAKAERNVKAPKFRFAEQAAKTHRSWALEYHDLGLAVIPMRPGRKQPYVSWQAYQKQRPSRKQVSHWWKRWPNAGIGAVLGPVSGIIGVDVDGEEAHRILIEMLGDLPLAPTAKSGSRDPFRYHLYFRHEDGFEAKARKTPFASEKLEIRGEGGLLVLPPSNHPSGYTYRWVQGKALGEISLPELPAVFSDPLSKSPDESLVKGRETTKERYEGSGPTNNLAKSTRDFLEGKHADVQGNWNNLLFQAACDLASQGFKLDRAMKLLMKGANPRDAESKRAAINTIRSAFSKKREPSRH